MNGKKARKLRKAAKMLKLSEKPVYTQGKDNLWGPLPYIKGTRVVDGEELNKRLRGAKNPKWQTILTSGTWYQRFVRYVAGKPIELDICERQVYQQMKKKYKRSMVS